MTWLYNGLVDMVLPVIMSLGLVMIWLVAAAVASTTLTLRVSARRLRRSALLLMPTRHTAAAAGTLLLLLLTAVAALAVRAPAVGAPAQGMPQIRQHVPDGTTSPARLAKLRYRSFRAHVRHLPSLEPPTTPDRQSVEHA